MFSRWLVFAVIGLLSPGAVLLGGQASTPPSYTFALLAVLGDPAPGGGEFVFDFEPWTMNEQGEVAFAADLTTGGEGVFIARTSGLLEIMRSGDQAPGGGTFEGSVLAETTINDRGDVVFPFTLHPFSFPFGVNAGLYRFSHARQTLSAVVMPFVTPAPGGSTFSGVSFRASTNNGRAIAFAGVIPTEDGIRIPGEEYLGLGEGTYRIEPDGQVRKVVSPGDAAPGGGTFDYAGLPSTNDRGDIAFDAHLKGEECIELSSLGRSQAIEIHCLASVYVQAAATGEIRLIVRQGDPAPGSGTFRFASNPKINEQGDIAFFGDLTQAPGFFEARAVFMYSRGRIAPVVRPGDVMPGGGRVVNSFLRPLNYDLNDRGEVSFHAILDTDVNGDGALDTGLFVWSRGSARLVARTGTVIPRVGAIAHVVALGFVGTPFALGAQAINNRGQVVVQAVLDDGRGVMLLATPTI